MCDDGVAFFLEFLDLLSNLVIIATIISLITDRRGIIILLGLVFGAQYVLEHGDCGLKVVRIRDALENLLIARLEFPIYLKLSVWRFIILVKHYIKPKPE